ncbi:trimeric intracellular cation channel family protein [Streptococcus entericus]|uniref:trimeric intracellular cation channel family protein n=1 Tax=Streptococcus entericus TaxID=155680 RepID=UPI00036AF111|nr:trimeric intracellular cation channel family protein [Streptococcus entericus]
MDVWGILNIIGTVAFAISGAIVAMEEEFDILGVFILGFVTAFGGGAVRNLLIGLPVSTLWGQEVEFHIAMIVILLLFFLPHLVDKHWKRADVVADAIGLAAFSIKGALHAQNQGWSLSAVIVAAVLTGAGGGIIRDMLAGRKPAVLQTEVYAGWSILAAILIHFRVVNNDFGYYLLAVLIVTLRMLGYKRGWHLPKSKWQADSSSYYVDTPSNEDIV